MLNVTLYVRLWDQPYRKWEWLIFTLLDGEGLDWLEFIMNYYASFEHWNNGKVVIEISQCLQYSALQILHCVIGDLHFFIIHLQMPYHYSCLLFHRLLFSSIFLFQYWSLNPISILQLLWIFLSVLLFCFFLQIVHSCF